MMFMLVMTLQNQHLHNCYQNHDHVLPTPWLHQLSAEDTWRPEILQKEGQDIQFCFSPLKICWNKNLRAEILMVFFIFIYLAGKLRQKHEIFLNYYQLSIDQELNLFQVKACSSDVCVSFQSCFYQNVLKYESVSHGVGWLVA